MPRLKSSYRLMTENNPKSPEAEAYKKLRTYIDFADPIEDIRTIMIASAKKGEGKSMTSANLAVAYALAGKKSLLIDADLREPTQHIIFHAPENAGLTTLLRLKHKFDDAVQPTSIMNLDLLPAGPVPSSSSEWLASAQMESVLAEAKERYDVVIVDTPSVLEATDASIVAALCDGVLLVINQGRTRKETVLQAKADLSKVKARFLGVVMNDARTRA